MARSKEDAERAVAERVAKGKDPEKALKKAFPDRDIGEVLWTWLADGLAPLSRTLSGIAWRTSKEAPVDAIVRTAMRQPRHPLRVEAITECLEESYGARAAEWDAQFEALPREVQLLLIPSRRRAGKPVPEALRDEALAILVAAAVDDQHDHRSFLSVLAGRLGVEEVAFTRQVVARLELTPASEIQGRSNIRAALAIAPWPLVRKVFEARDLRSEIYDVLASRADPAEDVEQLLRDLGQEIDGRYATLLARRMQAQGKTISESLDPALIKLFAEGRGDADTMAQIERFPPERFEAFASAVRATGTREPCCLGLLRDPALDAEVAEDLWVDIERGVTAADYRSVLVDMSSQLYKIVASGARGFALLKGVHERARSLEALFGAKLAFAVYPPNLRFKLRRAMFLATEGMDIRPLEILMPGEDLLWVEDLDDVFGSFSGGYEVLADLSEEDRARVLTPWARLNWDGMLDTRDPAHRAHAPPPIEEASWADLAAALEQTGYPRLSRGEKDKATVTRALQRAPSDAERVALVDRVLARAAASRLSAPVLRGLMPLVTAVLPAWLAEGRSLDGPRAAVAYALLHAGAVGDLRALLLRLPEAQVDGWIAQMESDPDRAVKKRAKEIIEVRHAGSPRS